MEDIDLIIVGAGWRGLAMAKTYHQVHPDASILILDEAETVGGVWAEERVYPGLRANNVSSPIFDTQLWANQICEAIGNI